MSETILPITATRAYDLSASIPGEASWSTAAIIGEHPGLDDSQVPETIWASGGMYPWLDSATLLEAVSSSAADTSAGAGAQQIQVVGLDEAGVEIEEIVNLSGTTPVPTLQEFYRVNSVFIVKSGSGQTNAGAVTVRVISAGTTLALIPAGTGGPAKAFIYTVPAKYWAVIGNWECHLYQPNGVASTADQAKITMRVKVGGNAGTNTWAEFISFSVNQVSRDLTPRPPPPALPPGTDIEMCITAVSKSNPNQVFVGAALGINLIPLDVRFSHSWGL